MSPIDTSESTGTNACASLLVGEVAVSVVAVGAQIIGQRLTQGRLAARCGISELPGADFAPGFLQLTRPKAPRKSIQIGNAGGKRQNVIPLPTLQLAGTLRQARIALPRILHRRCPAWCQWQIGHPRSTPVSQQKTFRDQLLIAMA